MTQIKLNLTMLEKVLGEVISKSYSHLGSTYLVIEELRVLTEEMEDKEDAIFNYYIIGRYGFEGGWDRRFDFMASSGWDYNFLAGYFNCLVDRQDYGYDSELNKEFDNLKDEKVIYEHE